MCTNCLELPAVLGSERYSLFLKRAHNYCSSNSGPYQLSRGYACQVGTPNDCMSMLSIIDNDSFAWDSKSRHRPVYIVVVSTTGTGACTNKWWIRSGYTPKATEGFLFFCPQGEYSVILHTPLPLVALNEK